MIDFDALRVFVAVVEHGGFNAAAVKLHKSQPAITATIKKLEDQLNFTLFDRNHYRPILTTHGEKLHERAKILINGWNNVNQFALNLNDGMESDITIAIDVFFPLMILKPLFASWMQRYPQTNFHFLSESLGGACERLVRGHADIIISENLMTNHAIEVIPLCIEKMIAVASAEFLEQYEQQLQSLDTLSECMQVILRDSSQLDFSFGVVGQCHHWTVSDVIAKKHIITAGLGWGRLPQHLIIDELADGRLQQLKGEHFDMRLLLLSAIRLQKPVHGPIVEELWNNLIEIGDLAQL